MSGAEFAGTMPVSERQRFDEVSLDGWLRTHLPGFAGLDRVEQFRGGQSNPTFLLTAVDGLRYVLRKKPAGALLPSAHAVDREFRIISALHGSEVPVARPLSLCTDVGVIGTVFYLMEYVAGRNFWDATLPGMTPPASVTMASPATTSRGRLGAGAVSIAPLRRSTSRPWRSFSSGSPPTYLRARRRNWCTAITGSTISFFRPTRPACSRWSTGSSR